MSEIIEDKNSEKEVITTKELNDYLESIIPIILEKRTALKKRITPFFVITIMAVLTIFHFDFMQKEMITFSDITIINGITIDSPRILVIYIFSILIWVLLVGFGVIYYQLITMMKQLRDIIENSSCKTEGIKDILLAIVKDAYLVDAVIGFYYKKTGLITRIISVIVILAFVSFIATGEYITLITISAFSSWIGYFLFIFYSVMYIIFCNKLAKLDNKYVSNIFTQFTKKLANEEETEDKKNGNSLAFLVCLFIFCSLISSFLNFSALVQYKELNKGESINFFKNKIEYGKANIFGFSEDFTNIKYIKKIDDNSSSLK